jgi:hypothetical protein
MAAFAEWAECWGTGGAHYRVMWGGTLHPFSLGSVSVSGLALGAIDGDIVYQDEASAFSLEEAVDIRAFLRPRVRGTIDFVHAGFSLGSVTLRAQALGHVTGIVRPENITQISGTVRGKALGRVQGAITYNSPGSLRGRGGGGIIRRMARPRSNTQARAVHRPDHAQSEIASLQDQVHALKKKLETAQAQPAVDAAARAKLEAHRKEYWAKFNALVKAKLGEDV